VARWFGDGGKGRALNVTVCCRGKTIIRKKGRAGGRAMAQSWLSLVAKGEKGGLASHFIISGFRGPERQVVVLGRAETLRIGGV